MRKLIAVLVCSAFLGVVATSAASTTNGSAPSGTGQKCTVTPTPPAGSTAPFEGVCDYLATRDGVVQAAIFDNQTSRTYLLSTGDDTQYTASIVKVDVLARWLNGYQRKGVRIPGDIPYSVRYLMTRMIENSDNAATTGLFHFGGGCDALSKFNLLIPLRDTKVGCESDNYYGWGNTQTSAADQLKLMKLYAYGGRPGSPVRFVSRKVKSSTRKCRRLKSRKKARACLRKASGRIKHLLKSPILGDDARDYGNSLMQNVEPDQRFGITCGPWGTTCTLPNYADPDPDVTVSVKNGWKTLPTCTEPIPQCPWQVNSTGWVRGKGRDYTLSILTTKDPVGSGGVDGFNYGIDTIQGISKLVWSNLG